MTPLARRLLSSVMLATGFATLAGAFLRAQSETFVSCLPDKAVTVPGERVDVDVWIASARSPVARANARWTVSAGRIESQTTTTARWLLDGAQADRRHTASVEVVVDGVSAGSCSLGVWVAQPPPSSASGAAGAGALPAFRLRGEYITRRAFLRAGQTGEQGFGLYSYFLMREPSTADDRARAARFVTSFLDVLVGVADQESYVERRRLNGSYMPVTMDPPQGLSAEQRSAWALEHYDYEHAKALLSLYPSLTGRGPFIVAVPAPLRSSVKPMLPWDFSHMDGGTIPAGVSRFLNQAAQLYDWQNQSALQALRDRLLTVVAGMFVGRAAAEEWMPIVR